MTKQDFLTALRNRLSGLPGQDIEERLTFYSEMIDDRMEEGCPEEQAVSDIGSVEEVAEQILADIPLSRIAKEKIKTKRRMRAWEIVLLAAGSPLWIVLLAAAFVILLSVYLVIWTLVACAWVVFGALSLGGVGAVTFGMIYAITGLIYGGLASVAVGLVAAGLAIFAFFGCFWTTRFGVFLTKKIAIGIKNCFVGGGKTK